MTLVTRQRYMDEWDKQYASLFSIGGDGVSQGSEADRLRRNLGIKPAQSGKQGSIRIESKRLRITSLEQKARQQYFEDNPDEVARVAALDADGKRQDLEEWITQYRLGDSGAGKMLTES